MPYTARDHLRHTNKAITHFQRYIGATVLWFEWEGVVDTTPLVSEGIEDLYDEGGTQTQAREWMAPKPIPVYSVIRVEGVEVPGAEGMYPVDSIHFSALLHQIRIAGLTYPYEARRHLFDRVVWDGFVWEIRRYQIMGRLQENETTVSIDATRVMPDEMVNDPDFAAYDQESGPPVVVTLESIDAGQPSTPPGDFVDPPPILDGGGP